MKSPTVIPHTCKPGICWGVYLIPKDAGPGWTSRYSYVWCERPYGHLGDCGPKLQEGQKITVIVDEKLAVLTG